MSAELGSFTHRACDSPIQALKLRKRSCNLATEHAEYASLFALFWSAATGRSTASIPARQAKNLDPTWTSTPMIAVRKHSEEKKQFGDSPSGFKNLLALKW